MRFYLVPRVGVEPTHLAVSDFESDASANFAIWASINACKIHFTLLREQMQAIFYIIMSLAIFCAVAFP